MLMKTQVINDLLMGTGEIIIKIQRNAGQRKNT